MPAPEFQAFDISSFASGIRQVQSLSHPPGTADDTNTYRCFAGQDGVLRALPKMVNDIEASSTMAFAMTSGSRLSSEYRIGGIYANDPVYSTAGGNATVAGKDQCNTEIWVGVEFWDEHGSTPWHRRVARYHRHRTTPSWTLMASSNAAGTYNANSRPKRCVFGSTRTNTAAVSTVGPNVMAWVYAEWAYYSPDDTTPTADSTAALPADTTNYPPNYMVPYQNRIIIFPLTAWGENASTVHPDNEGFYWTEPNDLNSRDSLLSAYNNTVAYVENSHGYEFAIPLAADKILFMKRAQGGLVLQGDLNFFSVDPKPTLTSPGLSLGGVTHTQIGYMYPVNAGGVYVYEGGDTCRNVSEFMDANFWRPDALNPANGSQSANGWGWSECGPSYLQNFALFPHNWWFDCDTESWWRIDPTTAPKDYHYWCSDWTQRWAWAAASGYDSSSSNVLYEYDMTVPANDWSWQSQPLAFSLDKRIQVDRVIIWAEAFNTSTSTIVATITSDEDSTGNSQTYTVPSSTPRALDGKDGFGVSGTGIVLKLVGNANSASVEAPRVHRVRVLYHELGEALKTA